MLLIGSSNYNLAILASEVVDSLSKTYAEQDVVTVPAVWELIPPFDLVSREDIVDGAFSWLSL